MTLDEIREQLRKMGVPVDSWQPPKSEGKVTVNTIPTFERMAESLKDLGGLIEKRIEEDRKEIQELQLKMKKLKHGGGR